MKTGHAYARGFRAHMLSVASIVSEILATPNCLNTVNQDLWACIRCCSSAISNGWSVAWASCYQLTHILGDLEQEISLNSSTWKLWNGFLQMVHTLLLFISAELTGDWELHLFCVARMIPVLNSGGHTDYAKYAPFYMDQMRHLPNLTDKTLHERYTKSWTGSDVHAEDHRRSGTWSGRHAQYSIKNRQCLAKNSSVLWITWVVL